jgi:hypothetical protein
VCGSHRLAISPPRLPGPAVPDELWSAAVEVARKDGVNRTATRLRLEWNELKRRMAVAGAGSGCIEGPFYSGTAVADPKAVKSKSPARPDFATLGGLFLAIGGIAGGLILEGGKLQDVAQITSAMIVLGGTLGAVMITTPLAVLIRAAKQFPNPA